MSDHQQDSNVGENGEQSLPLPFKRRWFVWFVVAWLLLGAIPILLVKVGNWYFSIADKADMEVAGTVGDAFGLANAFFSGGAFLLVLYSSYLQRQELHNALNEWQANTQSQEKQAEIMAQSARLEAINNVIAHTYELREKCTTDDPHRYLMNGQLDWAYAELWRAVDAKWNENVREKAIQHAGELRKLIGRDLSNNNVLTEVLYQIGRLHSAHEVPEAVRDHLLEFERWFQGQYHKKLGTNFQQIDGILKDRLSALGEKIIPLLEADLPTPSPNATRPDTP
jgi:hypothetical protein